MCLQGKGDMTTWWLTGRDDQFRPPTSLREGLNEDIEELLLTDSKGSEFIFIVLLYREV